LLALLQLRRRLLLDGSTCRVIICSVRLRSLPCRRVKELEELLASVRAGRHQAQLGEKSTAAETVTLTQQLLAVTADRDAMVQLRAFYPQAPCELPPASPPSRRPSPTTTATTLPQADFIPRRLPARDALPWDITL
jgi:hypothetical protein